MPSIELMTPASPSKSWKRPHATVQLFWTMLKLTALCGDSNGKITGVKSLRWSRRPEFSIAAKVVVNAAGGWWMKSKADHTISGKPDFIWTKGVHIVGRPRCVTNQTSHIFWSGWWPDDFFAIPRYKKHTSAQLTLITKDQKMMSANQRHSIFVRWV